MTLTPENRVILTDLLRPPSGFRVDRCVATTYSLDLTALLLAPLTFALFDEAAVENLDRIDPIRVLEATRRYSKHVTVFYQAGAVAVPTTYRSVFTFVEESLHAVTAPTDGRIFHPKIWALRFENQSGGFHHRFVCTSRNLTFDRSWDTVLCLDEADADGPTIDATPLAEFLTTLPDLTAHPPARTQSMAVRDLARSFRNVQLALPAGFTAGSLLPLGLGEHKSPFPHTSDRVLAISPFLDQHMVATVARISSQRTLLSRPDTLDAIGASLLDGWHALALQRQAEQEDLDPGSSTDDRPDVWQPPHRGLHAKTMIFDLGRQAQVITGSANLTTAAWQGNVEFDVVLQGPIAFTGVAATLEGTPENPGLERITETYTPQPPDPDSDLRQSLSKALEAFHCRLALAPATLHVTNVDTDRARMDLSLTVPADAPGTTEVWPVSLSNQTRLLGGDPVFWETLSIRNVTPFLGVETSLSRDGLTETRRCVIAVKLTGDIAGRDEAALRDVLTSADDLVRYLVFLLGDPAYDAMLGALGGDRRFPDGARSGAWNHIALAEPLIKAAGRDDDAIARVAELLETLQRSDSGTALVEPELQELWDAVWAAHQEVTRG